MAQAPASTLCHGGPRGKNPRAARQQPRSLLHRQSLKNSLRHPQHRGSGLDRGRRRWCSPPQRLKARLLGACLLPSSIFWHVVWHSWNVPRVPRRAPSHPMVGACGSSRMTNAPRRRPIPDNDGPGGKRAGMWSVVTHALAVMVPPTARRSKSANKDRLRPPGTHSPCRRTEESDGRTAPLTTAKAYPAMARDGPPAHPRHHHEQSSGLGAGLARGQRQHQS
jgi:hypothetical protein